MNSQASYQGQCLCGAVRFSVSGEPAAMGYCHCQSCRHWSAGPVNAFTLWPKEAVEVTQGAEHIGRYNKTPQSTRQWCKACGGHLFTEHPDMALVDVYAALIPAFAFSPGVHVHYQEAVLRIKDGLPKWRDVPENLGGSGISLAE
ncbi:GFA family protein [Pseudomonas sp. LPB0260]|uniref:GFA family protein n=1 Tax=Pseudomonas sp. LPB0260 TaxID=2614442 RepID=UPI0015C247B5|nr:GFA family protein [Pseudomonas sp. LPB0260]QLC73302.1 GFA family protein [Pseudomonas sp. LPB0260]QLC76076.1 GFA family protein [Pseudomonas sp. LPB0260]